MCKKGEEEDCKRQLIVYLDGVMLLYQCSLSWLYSTGFYYKFHCQVSVFAWNHQFRHCVASLQAPPAVETAEARPASFHRRCRYAVLIHLLFCVKFNNISLPFLSSHPPACLNQIFNSGDVTELTSLDILVLNSAIVRIQWLILTSRFPHRDLQRLPPNEA